MNLNLNTKRILCYGDSNTWGCTPQNYDKRYPVDVRWTGLLQKKLGEQYWIIEEGLNGRTTALDEEQRVGRNGLTYLAPCLESQNPLDIVILMLGTNDLKELFHQTPQDVADNIEQLVLMINRVGKDSSGKPPKIIVVAPVYLDETVSSMQEKYRGAEAKSKQLATYYENVAKKYGCEFIDIAKHVSSSKHDGCHLDPEAHNKVSEIFYKAIVAYA